MRILITNITLSEWSGTTTAVRDLAPALRRRGHTVVCYSPHLGRVAAQIRGHGTPVTDQVAHIAEPPDVIHGHHSGPTMIALARFPEAPAVFACHDWVSVLDDPPLHPRIHRYLHVRDALRERLVSEKGIPPEQVRFWANTVDLERVGAPKPPPPRLRTAGVYSHPGTNPFLDVLAAGCAAHGIAFKGDLIATRALRDNPLPALAQCDLVFASGRMAIEALAAGCAVVNADQFGVGGLVTRARLDEFIAANFAVGTLSAPTTEARIVEALAAYDQADAAAVTAEVRRDCGAAVGAERIEAIYREALDEAGRRPCDRVAEALALARYLEQNLQSSVLYNTEFARRRFSPLPEDELRTAVERLGTTVVELTRQTRRIARRAAPYRIADLWERLRKGLTVR